MAFPNFEGELYGELWNPGAERVYDDGGDDEDVWIEEPLSPETAAYEREIHEVISALAAPHIFGRSTMDRTNSLDKYMNSEQFILDLLALKSFGS